MPAQFTNRNDKDKTYFHVYNRGAAAKIIFKDDLDYQTFLNYLKEYLSSPVDRHAYAKTFTVKGRTFQGVPHLTKNYCTDLNLLAYNFRPNHFHLVLQQLAPGSVEKFIRSLCTRYSMYFNKRYQQTGSVFDGPYKSVCVESLLSLVYLTRYLHRDTGANSQQAPTNTFSSLAEYIGKRQTPWVKPGIVVSALQNSQDESLKHLGSYQKFVDQIQTEATAQELLTKLVLEKDTSPLAGSPPSLVRTDIPKSPAQAEWAESPSRLPGYIMAVAIFVLLFGFGFRNVWTSNAKATSSRVLSALPTSSPSAPEVSGVTDEQQPRVVLLAVKTTSPNSAISIRGAPNPNASIVSKTKDGDVFELVSINSGWFGVKLFDGSTGYISSTFIQILEEVKP
jgi:putative transposase